MPSLFERNAELKAQGFYMGEFEFKMLGILYYLNEGSYLKAYLALRRIIHEMQTTEGLVKMPEGASSEELMEFLLERQNPETGAFMDSGYPFFTYLAPTANVVDALDGLARQTGRPLRLKHPLRFLDEIRTPEQLRAYVEPLLYIKESWANMGGPGPYGPGISELKTFERLEQLGLYEFSDEWEHALREFYYETQDPKTGYWGVRIGTPDDWRQNEDPNSTYHIIKFVVDEWGEDRSEEYPLRYGATLARSLLKSVTTSIPDDPVEQHDWNLNQAQGARMITRRLWPHLSETEKVEVRATIGDWLTARYSLFRPKEGGFAIHTSAASADVEGTGSALMLLLASGSLPGTPERERLWGKAISAMPDLALTEITGREDSVLPSSSTANSIRVFKDVLPVGDTYDDTSLVQVLYPEETPILDIMDLRQNVARFISTGGQDFGNWISKESLRERPLDLEREVKTVPVSHGRLDLAGLYRDHPEAIRFYVIGYDLFQVPVFRIAFSKIE